MGQSTWGLISRVSSRTYRECQTLIHEHVQPSTCSQPSRHANYGPIPRSTTNQDSQPNVSKRSLPKWCPIRRHYEPLLGTVGITHLIHSGTNAKYAEIRNTEMYAVMKGCPIKEGYKNWEE